MVCKVLMIIVPTYIVLIHAIHRLLSLPASTHVILSFNITHQNATIRTDDVYFLNGVAYDFYSLNEQNNHSQPSPQWKTFPLPHEHLSSNITPWTPLDHVPKPTSSISTLTSPQTKTGVAFVDHIYVTTTSNLKDRQANLERMFARYQIGNYEWRMKWVVDSCNSPNNKDYVYTKLNLEIKKPIGDQTRQRQCAITMEHVDIWHDIIARNSSLSLILEDDAVFVPFFREKLDRTIYTAIRTGALKIDGLTQCVKIKSVLPTKKNEWFEQDPMIFIGTCLDMFDDSFRKNERNAQPILTTHKETSTRCSHAYLLTACSAQALLRQISARKNKMLPVDIMVNNLVGTSQTLQSFWLDPPIVYQGNKIRDLDGIASFNRTTY